MTIETFTDAVLFLFWALLVALFLTGVAEHISTLGAFV
jgi:hypothetical protein